MSPVLTADLGGTKTTVALVADGRVQRRTTRPTPAREGGQAVVGQLVAMLREVGTGHDPSAVAVGSAGIVDARGHIVSATEAIRGWAGTDLAGLLGAATALPTHVLNDVHAHALGEVLYGAGAGRDPVLVVAVGTGVGGALVSRDRVLFGAHGAAGHFGHVASPIATGIRCPCGALGHVEAVASGPGIVRSYRRLGGPLDLDARSILGSSEPAATRAVALGAAAMGVAIGGWVNSLDPEVVVVTGGVAADGSWFGQVVEAAAAELVPALEGVPIVPAMLGADAPLLGAAAFAAQRELVR